MNTDGIIGSIEAICLELDCKLNSILLEKQIAPREWSSVLPKGSYNSDFDRQQNQLIIDSEVINLYDLEQTIKFFHKEITSFQYRMDNTDIIGSALLMLKAIAALEIIEQLRNEYFFMGDGNTVKGLFNNRDLVDITAQLPTSGDIVNWVSVALAHIREVSLGIVKASTILVSPMVLTYLNSYENSSNKSYYTKVSEIVTDTPGGNPQTLKIIVLDILSTTVSTNNPWGDIYFLTNNPGDYRYFYHKMLAKQFVSNSECFIEAETDAKYSDPCILTKYALTKATPNFPTNMEKFLKIK